MDDERMTYSEIRGMTLECFYDCCRHILSTKKKLGASSFKPSYDGYEIGYASYQFECTPFSPIEKLMFEVFSLILMAGRGPRDVENNYRNSISAILEKTNLESLIEGIDEEEKTNLLYDMELLGLLDKAE